MLCVRVIIFISSFCSGHQTAPNTLQMQYLHVSIFSNHNFTSVTELNTHNLKIFCLIVCKLFCHPALLLCKAAEFIHNKQAKQTWKSYIHLIIITYKMTVFSFGQNEIQLFYELTLRPLFNPIQSVLFIKRKITRNSHLKAL